MDVGAVVVIAGAIHWLLAGYRKIVRRAMPPRASAGLWAAAARVCSKDIS